MDLLGLDSLTSSFGMLVLCRGIASILGPPLAGLVYDMTEQYNASFYLAGAFFVTGGLISFVAYFMDKRRNKKWFILQLCTCYTTLAVLWLKCFIFLPSNRNVENDNFLYVT